MPPLIPVSGEEESGEEESGEEESGEEESGEEESGDEESEEDSDYDPEENSDEEVVYRVRCIDDDIPSFAKVFAFSYLALYALNVYFSITSRQEF